MSTVRSALSILIFLALVAFIASNLYRLALFFWQSHGV